MTDKLEKLRTLLTSESVEERLSAIDLLYESGDLRSLPLLKKIARDDSSIQARYMAQRSIFLLSAETEDIAEGQNGESAENITIKLDKFTASYLSDDEAQRKRLIKAAVHYKATHTVPFLKEQATKETHPSLKGTLLVGIAILGGKDEIKFLSEFGTSPDPVVRHHLVQGLSQINSPSVYPLICSYLSDEDNSVKLKVVAILKRLGKNGIIQLIDHMLDSSHFWMRDAGAYALSVMSSTDFLPLLKKGMRDTDRRVREKIRRGIELLIEKGSDEAKDLLNKFSDMTMAFEDDSVQLLSTIQIGAPTGDDPLFSDVGLHRLTEVNKILDEGSVERLNALCAALQCEADPVIVVNMLKTIGAIGDHSHIGYVDQCLTAEESNIRMAAVEAVSQLSGAEIPDCLDPLLYDSDPMVRASAIVALKNAYPGPAINALEEMAATNDHSYRRGAIYALTAIADEKCVPAMQILLSCGDTEIENHIEELVKSLPDHVQSMI